MASPNSAVSDIVRALRDAMAPPARLLTDADRSLAVAEIYENGRLTPSYGFMLFSACGIAALGLLQSSVAVIIGAMLISPLMGPIMAMGMALARLDARAFRSAAITLAIGVLLSVLASVLIIWLSPLKDATPEILSRTRPTLLDLIVALLSGFVGAYLTINRKGEAIAGVAIATALMPPLAVVGYGLATAAWQIAGGAFLLFLTNVVSILGAVYGVARRYGFRPQARVGAAWETWALLGVILILCVPLAVSLRTIAIEARETTRVRSAVNQAFEGASPHIAELSVDTAHGVTSVQCVVVTRKFIPSAEKDIAGLLDPGAKVEVEQIVTTTGVPPATTTGGALANRVIPASQSITPEQRLRAMLSPIGQVQGIETRDGVLDVTVLLNGQPALADYRATEQAAQRFLPASVVRVIPPLSPFPTIDFKAGASQLDDQAARDLDTIAWALDRWGLNSAKVEGRATTTPKARKGADLKLAQARADAVADGLRQRGVSDITLSATVGSEEAASVSLTVPPPAPLTQR